MVKKALFNIIDMHCVSCAINIDGELEDTDGIVESTTNYAKAQTQVTFDNHKITDQDIISIIQKVGYTAEAAK